MYLNTASSEEILNQNNNNPADYVVHDPISITSNGDFITSGFPGFGNSSHPYHIYNLLISTTADKGISITGVTVHFLIEECYIDARIDGIYINGVASGVCTILNNTCRLNENGIHVVNSPYTNITDNECKEGNIGILTTSSNYVLIDRNICNDNFYSSIFSEFEIAYITKNNCSAENYALYAHYCDYTIISENRLTGYYTPLIMDFGYECIIEQNLVYDSMSNEIWDSNSITIRNNTFVNNAGYGLQMYNTIFSTIYHNVFYNNQYNSEGYAQAYDDGNLNHWYNQTINSGNYWSHHSVGPYEIDGEHNMQDLYPINGPDSDNDQLDDYDEMYYYETDPFDSDTDDDGVPDGDEVIIYGTDPNDIDTDLDGILDYDEIFLYGTNPTKLDTDNDNLDDYEELFVYSTNATNPDTDGDEMPDGWEVEYELNPLDPDDAVLDLDDEGLTNVEEYLHSTDPTDSDTDDDDLNDYDEVQVHGTDPTDSDSDNDGYSDGEEVEAGTDPLDHYDYPGKTTEASINLFGIILGVSVFIIIYRRRRISIRKS